MGCTQTLSGETRLLGGAGFLGREAESSGPPGLLRENLEGLPSLRQLHHIRAVGVHDEEEQLALALARRRKDDPAAVR